MRKFLYGNILAQKILNKIYNKVLYYKNKGFRPPHLIIILVNQFNEATSIYVNNKIKDCLKVGFTYSLISLPSNITECKLIDIIDKYNQDKLSDGIIVQLPLPKHINQENVITSINVNKDADGFHPLNFGKISLSDALIKPATPLGILELFKYYGIITKGKHIVIVGRSRIVGKPLSILLSLNTLIGGNATVTLTHRYTRNLFQITNLADILIVAVGIPNFIKSHMIKIDTILIDVGINFIYNKNINKYVIVGDADLKSVINKVSLLTPVPGGVGPMTRAMLIYNTFNLYSNSL